MAPPYAAHFAPALAARLRDVRVLRDGADDLASAEFVVAIAPPPGQLAGLKGLRCVIAPGAGVEHILSDPDYPRHVPLARLSQPDLRQRMLEYVVLHVLRIHRCSDAYAAQQARGDWSVIWPQKSAPQRRVGVMGLGVLGAPISRVLNDLGFAVSGWSRTPKDISGVRSYAGVAGLRPFLHEVEILVNLLPATAETRRILDAERLSWLPPGASLINVGRGATVDEEALLEALASGQVDQAVLDVFEVEPLPADHPFWRHPKVVVTPHCASAVTPEALAEGVADVIERVLANTPPAQLVDLERGY